MCKINQSLKKMNEFYKKIKGGKNEDSRKERQNTEISRKEKKIFKTGFLGCLGTCPVDQAGLLLPLLGLKACTTLHGAKKFLNI